MGSEHLKFLKIMSDRAKSIQGMLDLWMKGNIKILIQTLKRYLSINKVLIFMWFLMSLPRS